VLKRYSQEVEQNRILFEKGKELIEKGSEFQVISKNKPPVAGAIAWARSIFYRVKRPIMKFLTKEDILNKESFTLIKKEYKELSKNIDQY
jgi:dynein heavy chain